MPNRTATLTRQPSTPDGTFGLWCSDCAFTCVTVERPWLNNETDLSCVPAGTYQVLWQWSNKHNCNLYHLQNVPNRTAVEIHSANVSSQLEGCLAPGAAFAMFSAGSIGPNMPETNMQGVTMSVETLNALEADMQDKDGEQQPFLLTIKEA